VGLASLSNVALQGSCSADGMPMVVSNDKLLSRWELVPPLFPSEFEEYRMSSARSPLARVVTRL
jgi:hypothetical protein